MVVQYLSTDILLITPFRTVEDQTLGEVPSGIMDS